MERIVFSVSLRLCGLFLLLTAYCLPLTAQRDYTRWVNPFIGTGAHGHTFPGATMPFGMVQLSPDTRIDNWDGSAGYHYSDDIIYGFSHTHLSGTGIPDGCDILFMPTLDSDVNAGVGDIETNGFASKFSHSDEKAEPGYYSVLLEDGISAELTSTARAGLHRYTFRTTGRAYVMLDLKWRDRVLDSRIENKGNNRIEGYRTSSSWAKNQTVYFVAEFSKPFAEDRIFIGDDFNTVASFRGYQGKSIRAQYAFNTKPNEQVLLKVGISHVSIEGARKNLEAELPHWDFDKVRRDARDAWNKELSKIEVSGGTPEQTTNFYTALYHTMIHPNVFNDVDGGYKGHDGKIHSLRRGESETQGLEGRSRRPGVTRSPRLTEDQYTVFSLWDTFRAAHPLYTIIDQRRTVDFINTFIRQYEQGGRLPVWELWGEETDTMIGYHAVSVIADAMAKGIEGFDYNKAFWAAKHSADLDHFGLAAYKKRGYISMEDENESVSRTLEYAYNDWCVSQIAKYAKEKIRRRVKSQGYMLHFDSRDMQRMDEAAGEYARRARHFENVFDTKTGFFRPKKNGGFVEPFAPNEVTFGFTEGNSWQYSFFVPHDVTRLMELAGGREKFVAKLDELFTTSQKLAGREQADLTGLIGQYAHGNEPSHAHAYLYNYAGEPWKTQRYVRKIMDEFYRNAPDGLIGNEDCGQMSAWYVLSATGFYPVNPGDGIYAFGTPLFPEMTYRLENGKTFTVRARNVSSKNFYIVDANLNGKPYKKAFITHEEIMRGGILEFDMTDKPAFATFREFPVSSVGVTSVAVPVITASRTFADKTTVTMMTITPNAKIQYTTDDSAPTLFSPVYSAPFSIDRSSTIRAFATRGTLGETSLPVEAVLTKRPNNWKVFIASPYSTQYTGGGDAGLIDGIRGTTNFASGEWQGYQGKDFVAIVDMGVEHTFTEVGASFLQVANSWIWMPTRLEVEAMLNGESYEKIADIVTDVTLTEMKPTIREYKTGGPPLRARYVRFTARNLGKVPAWHPGAGGDPWIFVDELFVR